MTLTNLAFTVPGQPQGKGRPRSTKAGRHYTPARTVAYEATVALFAAQAMRSAPLLQAPIALEIDAYSMIPASWSKKRRHDALTGRNRPTSKPDWDNIGKAISDGCNGVVWVDDSQVVDARVRLFYGESPEVRVRIAAALWHGDDGAV